VFASASFSRFANSKNLSQQNCGVFTSIWGKY
jgi:hypothetical protein